MRLVITVNNFDLHRRPNIAYRFDQECLNQQKNLIVLIFFDLSFACRKELRQKEKQIVM